MKPVIVINNMKFRNDRLNLHIILFLITVCSPLKKYILGLQIFDRVRDENGQIKTTM